MASVSVPHLGAPTRKATLKQAVVTDLKNVKKSPKSFWDYFTHAFATIVQSIFFLGVLGVVTIIPIVMIIVGAVNFNYCKCEKYSPYFRIPIWLIVGGVFLIVKFIVWLINRFRINKMQKIDPNARLHSYDPLKLLDSLFTTFLFIWLIVGSVWVFGISSTVDFSNEAAPEYCHKGTYMFAYVLLIIGWIYICLLLFFFFCCLGAICCGTTAAILSDAMSDNKNGSHRVAEPAHRIVEPAHRIVEPANRIVEPAHKIVEPFSDANRNVSHRIEPDSPPASVRVMIPDTD